MVYQTMMATSLPPSSPPPPRSYLEQLNTTTPTAAEESEDILELAANDDLESFKRSITLNPSAIDEVGLWYGRRTKISSQMVLEHRTPLMVAATYGSIAVLNLILSLSTSEAVNRCCGKDRATALHCAASGGSNHAIQAVKLLLLAGADPSSLDANNHRPFDVIVASPKSPESKVTLEHLLSQEDEGSDFSSVEFSRKEYPIDPSLPDIKNSIYATDEFRMFSCKVRPCSRAYSHDWTECPFAHPGENARRRDPRKFHYSCVPCPDFRKGVCRRGDMCEYAHGVFECYLHPAQYRTRACKEGTSCTRRVCFFAHTPEELRPVYGSTGSAAAGMPMSPRAAMDMATAMNMNFLPGSPPQHGPAPWPQPNVPTLHLPVSSMQTSRLRSSLSAWDMPVDDFGNMGRLKTLAPSNLDDLFSAEMSSLSPRYNSDQAAVAAAAVFSAAQKSAILNQLQQLHQQQQGLLSPIKTTNVFSPKGAAALDIQQLPGHGNHSSLLQASLGISSPGRMSPRSVEPISPMGSRLSAFAQMEIQQQQQQQMRSLGSRDLGSGISNLNIGSPVNSSSLAQWGSPSGKLDWAVNGEELGRLRRSNSFELKGKNGEEPDVSWVQSLVKVDGSSSGGGGNGDLGNRVDDVDVLAGWVEDASLHN